jgi:hypothetical protein
MPRPERDICTPCPRNNILFIDYIARSIEMSGVVLATWASSDAVITATEELALELNCTNQDSKRVKECFKKKSTQEILDASEKIVRIICYPKRIIKIVGQSKI